MKIKLIVATCAFALGISALQAQLNITTNADGSDGQLIVNGSTNIDLSQAGTGSWTNTSAKPGFGTYDPSQWAVVFKYSNVVISAGTTVTFSNNATHAPVVWLVNGNVTINGELNLDGQGGNNNGQTTLVEPGPGGFRGANVNGGGFGPGGGGGPGIGNSGLYFSYPYGNLQIIPLIGGSGGNGSSGEGNGGGGGGGGAILIAASGTITVNGYCHANGGPASYFFADHSGSGGAIRLLAGQILGSGTIRATGGDNGRIRLEATNSTSLNVSPPSTVVSPFPLTIFPTSNAPTASIVSIVSQPNQTNTVPADPLAAVTSSGDDLTIATTDTVVIQVKTTNFPTNGTVNVYIKPFNGAQTILSVNAPVSGNANSAIWQVSTTLPYPSHTIIQARAVY